MVITAFALQLRLLFLTVSVRIWKLLLTVLMTGVSRCLDETQAEARGLDLDIQEKAAPVRKHRNTLRICDEGSGLHVHEDMYPYRFYEVAGTAHSSLDDRYLPEVWQHMARIEQFLTGNDDSTYVSKFYGKNLEPERLKLHRGGLIDIARQRNQPVKTFQDVVEMLSGWGRGEERGGILYILNTSCT